MNRWFRVRFTGLWRQPNYLKLWIGQTVSQMGSNITAFALPLTAILLLNASPSQIALLSAAAVAPPLVFGLLAGVWADRLPRRPLLILTDLGRAAVIGLVPLAALFGVLRIEYLYLVALAAGALGVLFEVAYAAHLPSVVARDELVEGNSKLEASSAVAEFTGKGMAGALVQIFTAPLAITFDACSFVVSAFSLLLIRIPDGASATGPSGPSPSKSHAKPPVFWRDLWEGVSLTVAHPLARALAGATAIFTLCGNLIGVALMLYLIHETHLAPAALGIIFGFGGVSALLGALLAERVTRRWGLGGAVQWGLALYVGTTFSLPLASGPAWLAITLLVVGQLSDGAYTVYTIGKTSLLQMLFPGSILGRLHASLRFVEALATLLGLALGGFLGSLIGVRATLFVAAGGMLLAPLWLTCSPLRKLEKRSTEA